MVGCRRDRLGASRPFRPRHDRAVFHFLIDDADRQGYLGALWRGLAPRGFAILAAFALTGSQQCSGLPVQRYSPESLQATLGPSLELSKATQEIHLTPAGRCPDFVWCLFRKGSIGDVQ